MALEVGSRLGHYDVTALIGEGGMGQVYQATDPKLNRQVALKILPEAFATDPDRLARFQREAQVLASLNHPNIAAIHGLEESEGTRALVLELVEGPTLADRIAQGPVPVDEALPIAKQIAEALEAAHEQGVIHRDLKPANIKVRDDGTVKVLDFGLAKALAPGTPVDLSDATTVTVSGTRDGVILGTPVYMSPEQVRGGSLDRRTDIWSFGCVLYELLTGKRAFAGGAQSDTLAAVLRAEPAWDRIPADTPEVIRRLLRRCLDKDQRRRLQAIGDARLEIEDLLTGEPEKPASVAHSSVWRSPLPWAIGAVGLLAVLLTMVGTSWWTRRGDQSLTRPTTRLDLVLPTDAPMAAGNSSLALSPDGGRLVYRAQVTGGAQLYLRDMDTRETAAIPGTSGGSRPFFSPDGEWLGFFAGGRLRKLSLAGGEPVDLADAPFAMGGAWASDDTIYFTPSEGEGLSKVPATGGQVQRITQARDLWPDILPGREALLFTGGFGRGIHSLQDGQTRGLLTTDVYYARYVPTGHLVYAERGRLLAVAFDLATLEVVSQPVTLLEDLRTNGFLGGAPFALSQSGLLVYAPGQDREFASLVWADHQGNIEPLGLEPGIYGESFALSPDGTQVAVPVREASGAADIWLYDIARDGLTRFTYGLRDNPRARSQTPLWTPDGRYIVYASLVFSSPEDEEPRLRLFWKPADGSQEAVQLTTDDVPGLHLSDSFNPDGSVLTVMSLSAGTGFDLWRLPLDGIDPSAGERPQAEVLLQTRDNEAFAQFSPDGEWIAYGSTRSGRYEVYVIGYPGPGPNHQISTDGGLEAVWHPSEPRLFYRAGTRFYAVDVRLTPEFEAGTPQFLFQGPFVNGPGYDVDISPDGERFLTLYNPQRLKPNPTLTVITNFFDELRRRVPAGR